MLPDNPDNNATGALRVAMVVGEASGDTLGAGLIKALRHYYPNLIVEGIAGPKMQACGARSLFSMEALSLMGFSEVIKHIPRILTMRYRLYRYFCQARPDVFIGIDAPDFNLTLEEKLRKKGIKTVHYNSPSVWAWRAWRIHKIGRAVDLMLTLLPFENAIYDKHHIPVQFVGHPLADAIALKSDKVSARQALKLPASGRVMAILPGSRASELHHLSALFIKTAKACLARHSDLIFVVPAANPARAKQFHAVWQQVAPQIPFRIVSGQAQTVMIAADVVLLASGTATLECMLVKRPMVVSYRTSAINAQIVRWMLTVDMASLPNLIANERIVPEYIQHTATVENLSNALCDYLENPDKVAALMARFDELHHRLRCNADVRAAQAVHRLIG